MAAAARAEPEGLFVLMHDGAQALLHRDRGVNDWVATWLRSHRLQAHRPSPLRRPASAGLAGAAPAPPEQASACGSPGRVVQNDKPL